MVGSLVGWLDRLGDKIGEVGERMARHNALTNENFGTEAGLRKHLGIGENEELSADMTIRLREAAREWNNYQAARKAGVESAEDDAVRLTRKLEALKAEREKVTTAAAERKSAEQKDERNNRELDKLLDNKMRLNEQRAGFGELSERDYYIRNEAQKLENEIAEKGLELNGAQIKRLEEYKAKLGEVYDLEQKRKKHGGSKGVDREFELSKVNLRLDNDLTRASGISNDRGAQEELDRITERLTGKRIELTEDETAAIREKLRAIAEAREIQAEMNAIYEASTGAQRQYGLTLIANGQLLHQGLIDQGEYARNLRVATQELEKSQSPLWERNKALKDEAELLRLNGREREIETNLLALENELREKGYTLTEAHSRAYRRQYEHLRDVQEAREAEDAMLGAITEKQRNLNLQAQTYVQLQEQLKGLGADATTRMQIANDNGIDISGTGTDFQAQTQLREQTYARIDELRRLDILSEQEASVAKMRIWQQEQSQKLSLATTFFDQFTGLAASENKEVAAIGKAAAVANATIKTYEAANAAYAAMVGIPVVGPGLAVAAAGAAVASGLVNVQNILSTPTGFKSGGYTGDMSPNSVAGVVHGREYVLDAATTSRLGRHNLDALRSGDAGLTSSAGGSSGGSGSGPVNVTVGVFLSREDLLAFMSSKEGEKVIVDAVSNNARTVSRVLKGAA